MSAADATVSSSPTTERVDHGEDAEDFRPISDHVPVTGLPPAEDPVSIDDERGPVGDVARLIQDPIRADRDAVDVAQQGKREVPCPRKLGVAERAVAANREKHRATLAQPSGDLTQVGELGRSDSAPVVAIEGEDHVGLPPKLRQRDLATGRRGKRETGRHPTVPQRDHGGDSTVSPKVSPSRIATSWSLGLP